MVLAQQIGSNGEAKGTSASKSAAPPKEGKRGARAIQREAA